MNHELKTAMQDLRVSMLTREYTIAIVPRGEPYATNEIDFVITHVPSGETVKLRELTSESLRGALK